MRGDCYAGRVKVFWTIKTFGTEVVNNPAANLPILSRRTRVRTPEPPTYFRHSCAVHPGHQLPQYTLHPHPIASL